ncbi:hypothetical protein KC345_g135 [Hortaea werneckii]|nr:hypothetical protein KC345_g135 [Hortaea werneckii]
MHFTKLAIPITPFDACHAMHFNFNLALLPPLLPPSLDFFAGLTQCSHIRLRTELLLDQFQQFASLVRKATMRVSRRLGYRRVCQASAEEPRFCTRASSSSWTSSSASGSSSSASSRHRIPLAAKQRPTKTMLRTICATKSSEVSSELFIKPRKLVLQACLNMPASSSRPPEPLMGRAARPWLVFDALLARCERTETLMDIFPDWSRFTRKSSIRPCFDHDGKRIKHGLQELSPFRRLGGTSFERSEPLLHQIQEALHVADLHRYQCHEESECQLIKDLFGDLVLLALSRTVRSGFVTMTLPTSSMVSYTSVITVLRPSTARKNL